MFILCEPHQEIINGEDISKLITTVHLKTADILILEVTAYMRDGTQITQLKINLDCGECPIDEIGDYIREAIERTQEDLFEAIIRGCNLNLNPFYEYTSENNECATLEDFGECLDSCTIERRK